MAEPNPSAPAASFNFKNAIAQMVQRNASDLLLKVGRPPTVRVNGELVGLETAPLKPEDLKALAEQVMTPRQVTEFAEKKAALSLPLRMVRAMKPSSASSNSLRSEMRTSVGIFVWMAPMASY